MNGKDAYPAIRKAVLENPEIYNEEQVRNGMFLHLDYYVTESSGHNSEYVAWFRKRPELNEKYCTLGTGWNPGAHAYIFKYYLEMEDGWVKEVDDWFNADLDLSYSYEYAANIYNAVFGANEMFEFNGSVRNFGLIDNLPEGSCMEVPMIASKAGMRPLHVGALPDQLTGKIEFGLFGNILVSK